MSIRRSSRRLAGAAGAALVVASLLVPPGVALAQEVTSVAVFGDNEIDDYLDGAGFDATLVSDTQISTEGFLDDFDVFFYTRNGADTPGASLSGSAAANVTDFVGTSRGVLLNGDFADTINGALVGTPNAEVQELISNSVNWAAAFGHGYVGEYTGAVAGLTTNADSLAALGFVDGTAGSLQLGQAVGTIEPTAAGLASPVLDGVDLTNDDPVELEFGASITGVDASHVLAVYNNEADGATNDGNPAVIAFGVEADVSLQKSASPDPVHAGGTLTYDLTAANEGPDGAEDVEVADELDTRLENAEICEVDTGSDDCVADPEAYDATVDVGSLANGASITYRITATVDGDLRDGPLTISNSATITSSTDDPAPANNAASVDVTALTVPDAPELLAAEPTDRRVALTWRAGDDEQGEPDGGSDITAYEVTFEALPVGGSVITALVSSPAVGPDGELSALVPSSPSLTNDVTYRITVEARNAVGDSDPSNSLDATPCSTCEATVLTGAGVRLNTADATSGAGCFAPNKRGAANLGATATDPIVSCYEVPADLSAEKAGLLAALREVEAIAGDCGSNACLGNQAVYANPAGESLSGPVIKQFSIYDKTIGTDVFGQPCDRVCAPGTFTSEYDVWFNGDNIGTSNRGKWCPVSPGKKGTPFLPLGETACVAELITLTPSNTAPNGTNGAGDLRLTILFRGDPRSSLSGR